MPRKASAPSSRSVSRSGRTSKNASKNPMNHDAYDDNYIRGILNNVKSIAMVGASPVNVRPSYFAFKYLAQRGYDMIPVNPGHVGKNLLDKPFVASLSDIGRPVDMIDIFRNSSHIMPVVDEALKLLP